MDHLTNTITDTALIFEGGGMRAAYTSAMVVTLLQAGIYLDYVAGVSAGASNLANYLSRDTWRARYSFVEFAGDPQFGNLTTWRRGEGLFNSDYIYQHTSGPGEVLEFDWDTFRHNPATWRVGAFRCEDGEQVWFSRPDVTSLGDMLLAVQASSSMPLLMPPTTIAGQAYYDGAIGPDGGIALPIAQRDGFDRFLVVMTRPRSYVKPPVRTPRSYRRVFRRWPAVAEALLARSANYNRIREELFDLEASGRAYLFFPDQMPVRNGERNITRLRRAHDMGLAQSARELPAIRDFLGI